MLLPRPAFALVLTLATLSAAVPAALAVPVAGTAVAGNGGVTLKLGGRGKAARALAARGVGIAAIAPARNRGGRRIALPVRAVAVGRAATVALRGGVALRTGKRVLRLRALRVRLAPRRATVTAKAGKRRVTVFAARLPKGRAKLDRSKTTAKLTGARLALTPRGARLLRARLALTGIPAALLGRLALNAGPRAGSGGGAGGGGTTGGRGGTGGGAGGGVGAPKQVCSTSGPEAGPLPAEPPVAAPAPGAVAIGAATMVWYPRDSWIRYINGGEGTSVHGGATNGPAEVKPGSSASLVYSFHFPFKEGWRNPDGSTVLKFAGGVSFGWITGPNPHCIDFSTSEPEVEIAAPDSSRAIFRFEGSHGTPFPNRRGVLVDLPGAPGDDQDGSPDGFSYEMPGTIPADTGSSVFAGFYGAGEEFGSIDITFTTAP